MCGIAGYITENRKSNKLQSVYKDILVDSVSRGHDATGLACTTAKGKVVVAKYPLPSPVFVKTLKYSEAMDKKPVSVIGHVRAATKGSPLHSKNNHPILSGNIVGVHNGSIRNDEYLTNHFELNRHAQVDSEVVFALLDKLDKLDPKGIKQVTALLDGAYALAFQHAEEPNKVWLVRGPGRPMVIAEDEKLQIIWFASEERFIKNAYIKNKLLTSRLKVHTMFQNEVIMLSLGVKQVVNEQLALSL